MGIPTFFRILHSDLGLSGENLEEVTNGDLKSGQNGRHIKPLTKG